MKAIVILGQCVGLNPVMGILQSDPNKMRFTFLSWKIFYSFFMCFFQLLSTMMCIYNICKNSITLISLAFLSFYSAASITSILFIRIAKRWSNIVNEISNSQLDEYVDPRVKIRCTVVTVALFIFLTIEHMLVQIRMYAHILDCTPKAMLQNSFRTLSQINYHWLYETGVTFSWPLGIFVQIMASITVVNWNYSDMFLICVSLYLVSIFDKINEKVETTSKKSSQPWVWRSLREDYTRATRLVRLFDDLISGVIFVSFANNLFFICLQLYNILQNGVTAKQQKVEDCPNYPSGPFQGYEYAVYYVFSLSLVVCRFLAVSLLASRVHSAVVKPTIVLYEVPTQDYCTEVQRFIEQIHTDEVALSGLQFFKITKSLVLSVAGTIVTYELVLLQFEG